MPVAPATATSSAGDALRAAIDALAASGVESPRLDAELLLAEAAGWDRARLAAEPERELPPGASRAFGAMVRRRLRREPVAYILGRKGFRRIELVVDRRALIPRPETELLVEVAMKLNPNRVLDVGTGSGAVALAIADELAGCELTATDTSPGALELARANAERLGMTDRIRFAAEMFPGGKGGWDLVVANLPYVSEADWDGLAPEIREYEPREALVAGPTGLEAIAGLLEELGRDRMMSALALEVGAGQADAVAELVRTTGFERVERHRDLAGIERVVSGATKR